MTARMVTEPLTVQCPHCGQWNEKVTSDSGHSAAAARANPNVVMVLVCVMCAGPFFLSGGLAQVITAEAWLELPAEWRGTIRRACQDAQHLRRLLARR